MCIYISGSVHDSRIFKNSPIYKTLSESTDVIILGDSGYGVTPFLMNPYPIPESEKERHYNKLHKRARCCVERSFGIVKRQFPCIKYILRIDLERVCPTIMAVCILHNMLIERGEQNLDFDENEAVESDDEEEEEEEETVRSRALRERGKVARRRIADILWSQRYL